MNALTPQSTYLLAAILLYLPSLWAKFAFGGERHTATKQIIALAYMIAAVMTHMLIGSEAYNNSTNDEIASTTNIIVTYICLAHFLTLPRRSAEQQAELDAISRKTPQKEGNITYYLRLYLIIPLTSVYYTIVILYGPLHFFSIDPFHIKIIFALVFIVLLTISIFWIRHDERNRGRTL